MALWSKPIGGQGSVDECVDRSNNMSGDNLCFENQVMNRYEVTYVNGEVLEVEAWTPIIAQAIAEEEADLNGRPLSVVSVELLRLQPTEG